jgi:hypothetical protein
MKLSWILLFLMNALCALETRSFIGVGGGGEMEREDFCHDLSHTIIETIMGLKSEISSSPNNIFKLGSAGNWDGRGFERIG